MNLFVLGWNLPAETMQVALAALRGMPKVYPQLDSETQWQCASTSGTVLAAAMHPRGDVLGAREYIAQQNGHAVFYDGLPVESSAAFLPSKHKSYWLTGARTRAAG